MIKLPDVFAGFNTGTHVDQTRDESEWIGIDPPTAPEKFCESSDE